MLESLLTLSMVKYLMAGMIVFGVWMFPAWIARQNKVGGSQMMMIRFYTWAFGWTGIGWLVGLYLAVKK